MTDFVFLLKIICEKLKLNMNNIDFNRNAVKPLECVKEGWALIKDRYWLFFGIVIVGLLLAGFGPFGVLLGLMLCGIYISLFNKIRGENVSFEILFKGFDHFSSSAITGILQTLPIMLFMFILYIPLMLYYYSYFATMGRRGQIDLYEMYSGSLIYVIPIYFFAIVGSIVINLLFLFAYPLIVERNMKAMDAVKLSFKAAWGNLFGLLGLMLLQMLLNFAGALACFVGLYFIMPVSYAANAIAYKQVFPLQESFSDGPPPPPKDWQ